MYNYDYTWVFKYPANTLPFRGIENTKYNEQLIAVYCYRFGCALLIPCLNDQAMVKKMRQ